MVLDRTHKIAYAALSERTDLVLLQDFCQRMGYQPITFVAYQTVGEERLPIYHTNVMMSVGPTFALVGFDSVDDPKECALLEDTLVKTNKTLIRWTPAKSKVISIHFAAGFS